MSLSDVQYAYARTGVLNLLNKLPRPHFTPAVVLRESGIAGHGLFAERDIRAGELLVVEYGPRFPASFVEYISEYGFDCVTKVDWGQSAYIVSAPVNDGEGGWINHSCAPNAGMLTDGVWIAASHIALGSEITCDYGLFETLHGWEMICNCGSTECRGTITFRDWRDDLLQATRGRWFAPYLKRHIHETTGVDVDRDDPEMADAIREQREIIALWNQTNARG